ncbi:MAG: ThuA domain-containing protein [Phaeodactylibacter sp.]|nr:ThuA domain-containing protein [Phaeodactylibacter sp.]
MPVSHFLIKHYLPLFLLGALCLLTEHSTAQQLKVTTVANSSDLPSLNGKKILVVHGGWEGHQPAAFAERVGAWLEAEGADLTISDSLGIYTDETFMSSVDLIIQYWTMGKITKEQEAGLLQAVKNGAGLAGCHGGTGDSFRDNPNYQYMVGGQWVAHPGGEIDYHVDIIHSEDPVTSGVQDFDIHTEQYYMHVDPNVKVLATTAFTGAPDSWIDGAVMPVVWKKYFGKGRVFYLSIGHSPDTFEVPEVWAMLTRGVKWASGSKYLPREEWLSPVYGR